MVWCRRLKPCNVVVSEEEEEDEEEEEEAVEQFDGAITVWACVWQVSVRNWASTLVLLAVFVSFLSASPRACRD